MKATDLINADILLDDMLADDLRRLTAPPDPRFQSNIFVDESFGADDNDDMEDED